MYKPSNCKALWDLVAKKSLYTFKWTWLCTSPRAFRLCKGLVFYNDIRKLKDKSNRCLDFTEQLENTTSEKCSYCLTTENWTILLHTCHLRAHFIRLFLFYKLIGQTSNMSWPCTQEPIQVYGEFWPCWCLKLNFQENSHVSQLHIP